MSQTALPPVLPDLLCQGWLDALSELALLNGNVYVVLLVVDELNAALQEGRPLNPRWQPLLNHVLAVQGLVHLVATGRRAQGMAK